MRTRLKLDLWLVLLATLLPIVVHAAAAEELNDDTEIPYNPDNLIEVEYAPQIFLPYREHRGTWAFVMGAHYELYKPSSYVSTTSSSNYSTLYGSQSIGLIGFGGGAKYNVPFGAIVGEVNYGQGSVSGGNGTGSSSLNVTKVGFSLGIWLDALMKEPYVVPYAQVNFATIHWGSSDSTSADSGSTGLATGFSGGLLVQLNWIDPSGALSALSSGGLENTYLDFFVSKQGGGSKSPDFTGDLGYGGGVRLEF